MEGSPKFKGKTRYDHMVASFFSSCHHHNYLPPPSYSSASSNTIVKRMDPLQNVNTESIRVFHHLRRYFRDHSTTKLLTAPLLPHRQ